MFLYTDVNIVYNFRTDNFDVYWILDRSKTGILDEKVDIILANFQKERKFINEVLENMNKII